MSRYEKERNGTIILMPVIARWFGVLLTAACIFGAGFLAGFITYERKSAPVTEDYYMPNELTPRYDVNISQTIEYGLIYSKTDMITGETRMYLIRNGKLKPFLSENSN